MTELAIVDDWVIGDWVNQLGDCQSRDRIVDRKSAITKQSLNQSIEHRQCVRN
jgi:hypothetical protein